MTHNEFNPNPRYPLLIVISGPSGVGKDSVLAELKARQLDFHYIVTATTRPPRANEVEGVDYFFVSNAQFADMIEKDELIEYALVYNDYKGIPKDQVRQAFHSGKDVVMRVDVQGAETIRRLAPDALLIFLTVENEQEMVDRLSARSTESPANLKLRIATCRMELKRIEKFDYIVPNHANRLSETVDTILAIIHAEHHRVNPRKVDL
ncbi:MAG: guanylate kinase [Anaerolineales bacterium]|jgi:guanylate kinase|nr:guanylate kinase [Anaerolineales bacterium]